MPPALPHMGSCMLNPESLPAYQLPYCFANRNANYLFITREVAGEGGTTPARWRAPPGVCTTTSGPEPWQARLRLCRA